MSPTTHRDPHRVKALCLLAASSPFGTIVYTTYISHMTFRSSHILSEVNIVANALANFGTWDSPPSFIAPNYHRDSLCLFLIPF